MATINLDDNTAKRLAELATSRGMTIGAFGKSLIRPSDDVEALTDGDFEAGLKALSFQRPTLPEGFSRADIYSDHD